MSCRATIIGHVLSLDAIGEPAPEFRANRVHLDPESQRGAHLGRRSESLTSNSEWRANAGLGPALRMWARLHRRTISFGHESLSIFELPRPEQDSEATPIQDCHPPEFVACEPRGLISYDASVSPAR